MTKLPWLLGALLCSGLVSGRPQFIEPRVIATPAGHTAAHAAVQGDWIIASMLHQVKFDPGDPESDFEWWEKIALFRRSTSGDWQMVQTLADEFSLGNSDEHEPPTHEVAMQNDVLAFSTRSGLQIFELVSGSWVRRTVTGAPPGAPLKLAFDGVTLLASSESCETAATAYSRQANGSWAASGQLIGTGQCDEFFQREQAVSRQRALVFEDGPNTGTLNNQVRVFTLSGGAWQPGATLPPPPPGPAPDPFFGPALALRGDVAMVAGNGTNVYRRDASGFQFAGKIPLLVNAFEQPFAFDIQIGGQFALQTWPGPATERDIAVVQPNSSGQYEHVATLGSTRGQDAMRLSGRRVVAVGYGLLLVYDLPLTFTPVHAVIHDFENGTGGWTPIAGQFTVARRGATLVYRQSSLTGDALAVNSADLAASLITADVRPTAFENTTRWVGLVARYIDENNFYYLTLRADNTISIRKKVNGVVTNLVTSAQTKVELGKNYRVSFEVVGNRLTYYINGDRVGETLDPDRSLTHGRTGVRTFRASADFDNVIVTPIPLFELAQRNFSSEVSEFDIVDGSWRSDGRLHFTQSSTAGDARALYGNPTEDQVLRASAKLDSIGPQTGSHWMGLMVRYTDASNYYYVSLRTSNELSLRKVVNGIVTVLDTEPYTFQLGQAYRVRFEAIGTKLVVYVNDQVRLQATDASHARGRYGLVTFRAGATFSEYRAWQP
ncbi:MAG TPA: hypothetical protein VFZ95_10220 [Steroidobacteraceae bacterium]